VKKLDVLTAITFGHRIAEDEADTLNSYFVETEQWPDCSFLQQFAMVYYA
jgi:hypothetical protein